MTPLLCGHRLCVQQLRSGRLLFWVWWRGLRVWPDKLHDGSHRVTEDWQARVVGELNTEARW